MRAIDADALQQTFNEVTTSPINMERTVMNPFKIPHCMQYAYNGSLAYSEHCCYPHLVLPPMFNTCGEDNAEEDAEKEKNK